MTQPKQRDTFWPVPGGETTTEQPDGNLNSNGFDPKHNLYDNDRRPAIPSGDWKVRPSDVKPRGRP